MKHRHSQMMCDVRQGFTRLCTRVAKASSTRPFHMPRLHIGVVAAAQRALPAHSTVLLCLYSFTECEAVPLTDVVIPVLLHLEAQKQAFSTPPICMFPKLESIISRLRRVHVAASACPIDVLTHGELPLRMFPGFDGALPCRASSKSGVSLEFCSVRARMDGT